MGKLTQKLIGLTLFTGVIYALGTLGQTAYVLKVDKNISLEKRYYSAKEYTKYWKERKDIFKYHPVNIGTYFAGHIICINYEHELENKK